jgi:hypothetical protein
MGKRENRGGPLFLTASGCLATLDPNASRREILIKALLSIAMISAALAVFLPGAANAAEIPFTVALGPGEQLTGTVVLDDSSGDAQSASGVASGVVNGKYSVDGANPHAEISGPGLKLTVNFERASQRFSARLDTCPASPDRCDAGSLVVLWEK